MKTCCWDAVLASEARIERCPECGAEIDLGLECPMAGTLALLEKAYELKVIGSEERAKLLREARKRKNTGYVVMMILEKTKACEDGVGHVIEILGGGILLKMAPLPGMSSAQTVCLHGLELSRLDGTAAISNEEYEALAEQVRRGELSEVDAIVLARAAQRLKEVSVLREMITKMDG